MHSWYAAHTTALNQKVQPASFLYFRRAALLLSIVLLVGGLVIIWLAASFWLVVIATAAYFFVLPLITIPVLESAGFTPPSKSGDVRCAKCGALIESLQWTRENISTGELEYICENCVPQYARKD